MANTNTLATALLAAQGEFPPIPKDKENPHFRSRYSSLDAIETACWPVLRKHGLLPRHKTTQNNGTLTVTFLLTHVASGENDETSLSIEAGATAQAIGSQITYLRRYTCAPALGICSDEDDDGEFASKSTKATEPKRQAAPAKAKTATNAKETFSEPANWPTSSGEEMAMWIDSLHSSDEMVHACKILRSAVLTARGRLILAKGLHEKYHSKLSGATPKQAEAIAHVTKEIDRFLDEATSADLATEATNTFG